MNIALTYLLGAIFYADSFHFWNHAFSELGTTITLEGTPNLTSSVIMTLGMFISGRLLLEVARIYERIQNHPHTYLKSRLIYIASLGSFISIFPNNLYHTIHSVGSACCIGGIFLFDLVLLLEGLVSQKPIITYILVGLLSLSVISYAITFFIDLPIKQATQKICLINLLLIMIQGSPQSFPQSSSIASHRPT
jgi:uncharacterized membrane protein YuzA (DUF378 family)